MNPKVTRILTWVIGCIFILLGIAGLFLPFLQGILFLLIGLYLLSRESPWAKELLNKIKDRYPRMARKLDEAKERAESWLKYIKP